MDVEPVVPVATSPAELALAESLKAAVNAARDAGVPFQNVKKRVQQACAELQESTSVTPPEITLSALTYPATVQGNPMVPALPSADEPPGCYGVVTMAVPYRDGGGAGEAVFLQLAASIVLQRGSRASYWLRILGGASPLAAVPLIQHFVKAACAQHVEKQGGVPYVTVAESASSGAICAALRAHGFGFFPHREAAPPAEGMLVYYAWPYEGRPNPVPPYMSSIEGVAACVLSPDEKKVLLVWELNAWSMVAGAVEQGEATIDAIARELREEVDAKISTAKPACFMGGYQQAKARDGRVNDNFHAFVVRARATTPGTAPSAFSAQCTTQAAALSVLQVHAESEEVAVDGVEIERAIWVAWAPLLESWRAAGRPSPQKDASGAWTRGVGPGDPDVGSLSWEGTDIPADRPVVMQSFLRLIDAYEQRKYISCDMDPYRCKYGGI